MSSEAIWEFRAAVALSPELRQRVEQLLSALCFDKIVELGREQGFEFTLPELRQASESALEEELNEFELEVISGHWQMLCQPNRSQSQSGRRSARGKPPLTEQEAQKLNQAMRQT